MVRSAKIKFSSAIKVKISGAELEIFLLIQHEHYWENFHIVFYCLFYTFYASLFPPCAFYSFILTVITTYLLRFIHLLFSENPSAEEKQIFIALLS